MRQLLKSRSTLKNSNSPSMLMTMTRMKRNKIVAILGITAIKLKLISKKQSKWLKSNSLTQMKMLMRIRLTTLRTKLKIMHKRNAYKKPKVNPKLKKKAKRVIS